MMECKRANGKKIKRDYNLGDLKTEVHWKIRGGKGKCILHFLHATLRYNFGMKQKR